MAAQAPQGANPWDYGLGFRERNGRETATWVEVHPASTSEVVTVLKKLEWLQTWLRRDAPALQVLSQRRSGNSDFWLAIAAGVHITNNSPQARQLRLAGLDLPRYRLERH